MGTKGWWSYHFRKRYFCTYSSSDSYPDGLGEELVTKIPTDPEQFAAWKTSIEETLLRITGVTIYSVDDTRDAGEHGYVLTFYPPRCDEFINWTYVIDLDRNSFTINDSIHFKLDNIPRAEELSWLHEFIEEGYPYYLPDSLLPYCHFPEFTARRPTIELGCIEIYRNSCVKVSDSLGISDIASSYTVLGKLMIDGFRIGYDPLLRLLDQWSSRDYPFQQLAFGLLSLMCSGGHRVVNREQPAGHLPTWNFPFECQYRLPNGAWAHLETHLDSADNLQSAIGKIINMVREEKLAVGNPYKAVLFSIRHVVLVMVQNGGQEVLHSNVLEGFDEKQDYHKELPAGFLALLHFLCPKNVPCPSQRPDSPACFPTELFYTIFEFADIESRIAWSQSSKLLRQIYLDKPLFGQYIIKKHIGGAKFLAIEGGMVREIEIWYRMGEFWTPTERPMPVVASNPLIVGSYDVDYI